MVAVLVILLVVLGIWAIAWSMDSYASAQQAQATIEAARAARAASFTSTLLLLFLLLIGIVTISAVVWYAWQKRKQKLAEEDVSQIVLPHTSPQKPAQGLPGGSLEQLTQLMMLKMLSDMMKNERPSPPHSANT